MSYRLAFLLFVAGGAAVAGEQGPGTPASPAGFSLGNLEHIGRHYGETLRRWRANLDAMGTELPALGLDTRFGRLWDFYLAYCEAGFEERYVGDAQLLYTAPVFVDRHDRTSRTRTQIDSIAI